MGKIEKPLASKFKAGRKLFFVPLVYTPRQAEPSLMKIINRYWDQVEEQLKNLEGKLSGVKEVYYELLPAGGRKGLKAIKAFSEGSHRIVEAALDSGARLRPVDDGELLAEFMDWSRCLAIGLQSQAAIDSIYRSFTEVQKRRNDHIAKSIDKTLKRNETGMLMMREEHQVQFPSDIEVFYVAPPGLDEIRRWFRAQSVKVSNPEKPVT